MLPKTPSTEFDQQRDRKSCEYTPHCQYYFIVFIHVKRSFKLGNISWQLKHISSADLALYLCSLACHHINQNTSHESSLGRSLPLESDRMGFSLCTLDNTTTSGRQRKKNCPKNKGPLSRSCFAPAHCVTVHPSNAKPRHNKPNAKCSWSTGPGNLAARLHTGKSISQRCTISDTECLLIRADKHLIQKKKRYLSYMEQICVDSTQNRPQLLVIFIG